MSNVQCENGRLKYDPQEILQAYVGVNDLDISHLNQGYLRRRGADKETWEKLSPQKHSIEKVILHPSWDGSGTQFPDLALLKLKKKVTFVYDKWDIDRYKRYNHKIHIYRYLFQSTNS